MIVCFYLPIKLNLYDFFIPVQCCTCIYRIITPYCTSIYVLFVICENKNLHKNLSLSPDMVASSIYGAYYRDISPNTADRFDLQPLTPEPSYKDMSLDELRQKCDSYGLKKLSNASNKFFL